MQKDLESLKIRHKTNQKIYYLNQSYLIHIVAKWEVFIEDLAQYGFDKLTPSANFGAGNSVIKKIIKSDIAKLNTADTRGINSLLSRILDIKEISTSWYWEGITSKDAEKWLDKILVIRHKIAHTGETEVQSLSYEKNYTYMKHLFNLAFLTESEVERHVAEKLGKKPIPLNRNVPYPENFIK